MHLDCAAAAAAIRARASILPNTFYNGVAETIVDALEKLLRNLNQKRIAIKRI